MKKRTSRIFKNLLPFISLATFFIIMFLSTKLNIETKTHIIDIWFFCSLFIVPIAFYLLFFNMISQKFSYYFYNIYSHILTGVWMAVALNSIFILDKWFNNPDNGKFEPLFVMLGTCIATIIYSGTFLDKIYKKDNKALDDE